MGHWIEIGRMDDAARRDSPVHRLDARAKALATLAFIVVVMSSPRYSIAALTPFFFYPVALVALGRLPVGFLLRKLIIAAPFAVAVGVFNPFLDRTPVLALGSHTVSGGWLSFTSIMLRFVLTVTAALALVACTGMDRLCAGLERMGLPRVFATQLLFLYRYLFVVSDEGARMVRAARFRSRDSRSLGLRAYGSLLGHLLLRSMDRAQRIHWAMVARGFDGEIRVLRRSVMRAGDWAFLLGWGAFFVAARVWNLAGLLGSSIAAGR